MRRSRTASCAGVPTGWGMLPPMISCMADITGHESEELDKANASGRTPVVFVHGLWLLPSSWERWAALFEEQGYVALTPGWPDDPETVAEAKAHPEVFAGKGIGEVADHHEEIIRRLGMRAAPVFDRARACRND